MSVLTEAVVEVLALALAPADEELDDERDVADEDERGRQDGLALVLDDQAVAQELPHLRRDRVHLVERVAARDTISTHVLN